MATDRPLESRLRTAALVCVDVLAYAVAMAAVATPLAVVAGIATGGGLVRAKALLFLAGILLMTYATITLWPPSPKDIDEGSDGLTPPPTGDSIPDDPDPTRFQALVRSLPPLRWLRSPPPDREASRGAKLFVASVALLAVSFVMETVFGIV